MAETWTGTQLRIITATIDCIEEHGVEGTTIRRIAAMAGVNSAAISYYFRSKSNLIDLALKEALKNAFDWDDFRGSEHLAPRERLTAIVEELTEGAMRYPGTARALFHETLTEGRYDTVPMQRLGAFLEELAADLKARGVGFDDVELRTAIAQVVSASLLIASLMPHVFDGFMGASLADPQTRRRYVSRLVERLLPA